MTTETENRKDVLLRAAYDLLKRNAESPYVESAGSTCAFYDDANCDGHCLMEDIMFELDLDDGTKPIPLGPEDDES